MGRDGLCVERVSAHLILPLNEHRPAARVYHVCVCDCDFVCVSEERAPQVQANRERRREAADDRHESENRSKLIPRKTIDH